MGRVVIGGSTGTRPAATFPPHSGHETAVIDDDATLGHNAFLYLNRKVPKLVVEIDAVPGYGPASAAVDMLRRRLGAVVDKPGGIQFVSGRIDEQRDSWGADDLQAAVARWSRLRSNAGTMVMHVLYVNGTYSGSSDAVGIAFSASSTAIFKQQVNRAATPLVGADAIEQADIVHEAGHVLSLVNIGYRSPRNHEDPQHPGHSNNVHSVMYWAIDRVDVVSLLGGSARPSTEFDSDDAADLRDIRSGRLP